VIVQKTNRAGSATFSLLGIGLLALVGCGDDPLRPSGTLDPSTQGDGDEGGDGDDSTSTVGKGIPCDLQDVIASKCTKCHGDTPNYSAPMSLTSYANFTSPSEEDADTKIYELVKERINKSGSGHMPPSNQPQLTASEKATLNAWLDEGAPKDTSSCESTTGDGDSGDGDSGDGDSGDGDSGDGDGDSGNDNSAAFSCPDGKCTIDKQGLECYNLTAHASGATTKYPVGTAKDKYVNFHFKAPWTGTAYGIVLRPIIDNTKVIHHWLLFQQEGGTGVTPGAVKSSTGTHPDGDLVHGWAPGGGMVDFRKVDKGDIGFEFKSGDAFILEIHYNSSDAAAADASGVEVCVQKTKPVNVAGVSWLGTDAINGARTQGTCDPLSTQPIKILGISPHMHLKGEYMKSVINRAGGTKETLHDGPFEFENQTWYPASFTIMPGDTITTRCDYSASATFGPGTTAEMCYLFTVAYPKGALANGDMALHGGGSCLGSLPEGFACAAGSCIQ
jgi:hypothetical protein